MIPLSARAKERLRVLFRPEDVSEAEQLLAARCGDAFAGSDTSPERLDRLRFAALRVSGGRVDRLCAALDEAETDWRDLLMSAGFGVDVEAHERWTPLRFSAVEAERWRRHEPLPTVAFGPGDPVEILMGRFKRQRGTVFSLVGLEPEPSYAVRLPGVGVFGFPRGFATSVRSTLSCHQTRAAQGPGALNNSCHARRGTGACTHVARVARIS